MFNVHENTSRKSNRTIDKSSEIETLSSVMFALLKYSFVEGVKFFD